jgi:hypothetical protein
LSSEGLLQKLAAWENGGRGRRRSEGFGQVLICDPWHLTDNENIDNVEREGLVRLKGVPEKEPKTEKESRKFDEEVLTFLTDNAETIHKASLTKTQLNGLRDRAQRLDARKPKEPVDARKPKEPDERPGLIYDYLAHAHKRASSGQGWKTAVRYNNSTHGLAEALIALLGVKKDEPGQHAPQPAWDKVRDQVDDFITGALLLTASEKCPDLKAACAEKGGNAEKVAR